MTLKEYHHKWYLAHKIIQNKKSLDWAKKNRDSRNKSQRRYLLHHPSFTNWSNMMERCYRKTNTRYHLYGGKGIKVCRQWHNFQTYEKEFGYLKPDKGYTVDRINNGKDYTPNNVRWATKKQQRQNQRHNNRFTKGRNLCQVQ